MVVRLVPCGGREGRQAGSDRSTETGRSQQEEREGEGGESRDFRIDFITIN